MWLLLPMRLQAPPQLPSSARCQSALLTLTGLPRLRKIMEDFFHRFMSPAEDARSKGVNTSDWRKITASKGETVVLRVQGEGEKVIGVLYGGTRARVVA